MKFIADGMLGSLARWLRLLGFDTEYFSGRDKFFLAYNAKKEGRIVLTRDRNFFLQHQNITLLIENEKIAEQLREIKNKLPITFDSKKFFSRCNICNNPLEPKTISEVINYVPDYVAKTQKNFSYCNICGRIYWQGTHWQRMLEFIKKVSKDEE
ncbi:MAG: Mut7-C RNAse domain-containing protein [Candidatus Omnitrophica bacterium]|nr:Mut7-C RNAse domain-containing protein [Candidatus Omnitrophota bacterium]